MSSAHTGPSHLRALRTRTTNTQHFESGALGLPSLVHIEQLEARQKSKRRHGLLLTDREIALSWAAQEARSFIALQNDRVFAQAIYETENGTRTRLPTTGVDKRFQDQLRASFHAMPEDIGPELPSPRQDDDLWGDWVSGVLNWRAAVAAVAEPSTSRSSPELRPVPTPPQPTSRPRQTHICVVCRDPIEGLEIRAPCGDYYDQDCIIDLFQHATRDESLFPPKCCNRPIYLAATRPYLPPALVATFLEKKIEFGTARRVYCAKQTCSRFLGPRHDDRRRHYFMCTAPGCETQTCGRCTRRVGKFHNCNTKSDRHERAAVSLGRSQGWVRCIGCLEMVERISGCPHMTCRCGAQFCYSCGRRWKTCKCTIWRARFGVVLRQPVQAVHAIHRLFI